MKTSRAVTKTCPCGEDFLTTQGRLGEGRGKYCSKPCLYKYRVRPTGLAYNLKVENPGWFKPGCRKCDKDHQGAIARK